MRAKALAPAGTLSHLSGGETSSASQVCLRGISAPFWKAGLVSCIVALPFGSAPAASRITLRLKRPEIKRNKNLSLADFISLPLKRVRRYGRLRVCQFHRPLMEGNLGTDLFAFYHPINFVQRLSAPEPFDFFNRI